MAPRGPAVRSDIVYPVDGKGVEMAGVICPSVKWWDRIERDFN